MNENKEEQDIFFKIQSLPEAVQDYLLSPKLSTINASIITKFKLSPGQENEYLDLLDQVFFKEIKLNDFVEAIKKFGLGEEPTKNFLAEVLGNILLPLEDYLGGGVGEMIKKFGGEEKKFDVKKVEIKSMSAREAAAEIYLDSGLKIEEPAVAKRIQDLIEMRLREVRDDFETAAALVRGKKVGGADLTEDDTKKILENIKAKMLGVQIVTEEQENREIPMSALRTGTPAEGLGAEKQRNLETKEFQPPAPVNPISPIIPISPISPISPIVPISPIKEVATPPKAPLPPKEKEVPAAIKKEEPKPVSPINLIKEAPKKAGTAPSAVTPASSPVIARPDRAIQKQIPKQVRNDNLDFNAHRQGGASKPDNDKVVPPKEKVAVADLSHRPASPELQQGERLAEAEVEREIGHIKKVVEKKMGKIAAPTSIAEAISRIVKSSGIEERGPDVVAKLKNIITSRLRDIRDKSETLEMLMRHPRLGGFGLPKDEALKLNGIIDAEFNLLHEQKREEVILKTKETANEVKESRKLKARGALEKGERELNERWMKMTRKQVLPKESPSSKVLHAPTPDKSGIKGPALAGPKEVEDIRPREILVGPIEELGKMTLGDFRKLALKPNEAILKIKSKIDLLAAEDISKKIAGIAAWKSSEMMKIYFDILRESIMKGKPVAQIIKDKEAAKLPILKEDEFKAIVELNRTLKI